MTPQARLPASALSRLSRFFPFSCVSDCCRAGVSARPSAWLVSSRFPVSHLQLQCKRRPAHAHAMPFDTSDAGDYDMVNALRIP
jgi:hypothetical protein